MTALLDRAIAQVRALPEQEQDVMAALLLSLTEPEGIPPLDAPTRAAIREGVAQAERGEFASDADIAALWTRYGV